MGLDSVTEKRKNEEHSSKGNRYTKKEIYQSIINAIKKYGKNVTAAQYNNDNNFPHTTTVKNRTGLNWVDIRARCGGNSYETTKEEVYNDMKKAIDRYDENITARQFRNDPEFVSIPQIRRVFDMTFNELKKECGCADTNILREENISEKKCHKHMRSAIEKYGMRIKQEQFNNDPEFTNTTTIKRVTGLTFNELKQKCNGKINNASQNVYFEDINAFTQEEAYVVGVIIGDGYVGDEIYLGAIDKDFVIEFAKNLCKLLSLKWDGWDAKNTEICCMGPIKKENYESYGHDQWRVSKGITNRVENYFKLYQNLSGEDYFNLLEEFQWYKRDLIRGLWDSEGSISTETGKLRFSNSNYYVLHLFMQLVSDVINIDYENSKNTDGSKENYKSEYYGEFTVSPPVNPDNKTRVVTIPSKYREKFFKKINPTIRRKRELFEKHIINKNRSKFHSTYKGREFNGEGVFDNLINQKT